MSCIASKHCVVINTLLHHKHHFQIGTHSEHRQELTYSSASHQHNVEMIARNDVTNSMFTSQQLLKLQKLKLSSTIHFYLFDELIKLTILVCGAVNDQSNINHRNSPYILIQQQNLRICQEVINSLHKTRSR